MQDVSRDLMQLQYDSDILMAYGLLQKWLNKSSNEELREMLDSVLRIDTYVKQLQLERYSYDRIISETVSDKCRAVKRAQKCDERIEELEKEVNQLKERIKVFGI